MYPRVALILDQRNGIIDISEEINQSLDNCEIRWATDAKGELKLTDYSRLVDPSVTNDEIERMGIRKAIEGIYRDNCPHIIFANPDTLRNRLWNPISSRALCSSLKHIVFDEN